MLEGKKTPTFSLPGTNNQTVALEDLSVANTVVLGISSDSVDFHERFSSKLKLNFKLLSDVDKKINKMYGTWQLRKE